MTALEAGQRLTLSEIERYLASAANLLRGSIDQADVKAYIFLLMLFKRISDTYREEFDRALAESAGDREYASLVLRHIAAAEGAENVEIVLDVCAENSLGFSESVARTVKENSRVRGFDVSEFEDVEW